MGNWTNRKWFSVVCTLIDNDIRHHSGQNVVDSRGAATIFNAKEVFISERNQNHDTKKEQTLSITFSQYDCFIFQNERSWLAIALRGKLTQAWREQRCLDSYRQRQISQSDCEITSNCGKNYIVHYRRHKSKRSYLATQFNDHRWRSAVQQKGRQPHGFGRSVMQTGITGDRSSHWLELDWEPA